MQCGDVGQAVLSSDINITEYMRNEKYLRVRIVSADRQVKVLRSLWDDLVERDGKPLNIHGEFINKNGEFVLDGEANSQHVYEYTGVCDDDPNVLVFTKLED